MKTNEHEEGESGRTFLHSCSFVSVGGLFLMLLLTGIVLCNLGCDQKSQSLNFKIIFSGDTRGRLVPCGCFTGQFGGLTRLKTYLDESASTNDIRVDIGDAIAGPEDFQRIQYQFILRAYAKMKYDALNLGHREAQMTLAQLQELKKITPVTLLSANLVEENSGKRIFDCCKILRRGTKEIALVGVMDPHGIGENLGPGVKIEPMESVLQTILPELRKKSDAVVLLAFTDENGLARLAQQFYEVDLILGGKVSQPSQKMLKENRSTILYTANESRTVGMLEARLSPKFVAKDFEMVMLHDKIAEDNAITKLGVEYREQIRKVRLDIDDLKRLEADAVPGIKNRAAFTGSEVCVSCHQNAAKIWEHSDHRRAFASLVEKSAEADPNCIGCHTVGFGTASGYRRDFHGEKFIDVGCESCHGPGSVHAMERKREGIITFKFRPLGQGDCVKCHFGEFSRPFDWATFWPKIEHGNEPKMANLLEQFEKLK